MFRGLLTLQLRALGRKTKASVPFFQQQERECRRRRTLLLASSRYLSTESSPKESSAVDGEDGSGDGGSPQQQQPFVQARIQAGEWNLERTDPLYRPKWKSRAQIVSAEDFANRPTVGFSGEFESFQDAMVTLSWLDDKEQKQIYQIYLELQNHAKERHKKTSHEYVMRVIGQKFNITPQRVAAIVQLQHNEEQIKKNDPDRKLLTEAAEYMDRAIRQEILDAYQTFNLKKPDEFVEDPVGVKGHKDHGYQVVEDLFDVDQLVEDSLVREEREARLIIDGHVYIEDIDDENISIPISKDAKKLVEAKKKLSPPKPQMNAEGDEGSSAAASSKIPWPATNGEGRTRPRWKYVAQTVNTREQKKKRAKHRSYTNNNPSNTLVEEDGQLREATLADVKLTSWKPVRNVMEQSYSGAKRGWLDRTVRGDQTAWGKAPIRPQQQRGHSPGQPAQDDATKKPAAANDDEDSDDRSSSSSEDDDSCGSEDDEGASSGSENEGEGPDGDSEEDDDRDEDNDKNGKDKK